MAAALIPSPDSVGEDHRGGTAMWRQYYYLTNGRWRWDIRSRNGRTLIRGRRRGYQHAGSCLYAMRIVRERMRDVDGRSGSTSPTENLSQIKELRLDRTGDQERMNTPWQADSRSQRASTSLMELRKLNSTAITIPLVSMKSSKCLCLL